MHGPFGVAVYVRSQTSDEEAHGVVAQLHPVIKSLPGFRSVMYYNVDELDYYFVISFTDEASTDSALNILRNMVLSAAPEAEVSKAEVVPGEIVDEILSGVIPG